MLLIHHRIRPRDLVVPPCGGNELPVAVNLRAVVDGVVEEFGADAGLFRGYGGKTSSFLMADPEKVADGDTSGGGA